MIDACLNLGLVVIANDGRFYARLLFIIKVPLPVSAKICCPVAHVRAGAIYF